MDDFVVTAMAMKLVYAAVAVGMVFGILRLMDWLLGDRFTNLFGIVQESSMATALYLGARILAVCVLVGSILGCTPAQAGMTDRYDGEIKDAVEKYWADYPSWTSWKAQLYQESLLDPRAVSPVGARGLAQFMPGTWEQVKRELRLGAVSPHHDVAIEAGAYYMRQQRRFWSSPRPGEDRQRLAQASYNAGAGNLRKAQILCGDPVGYDPIVACLPRVTGTLSRETLGYVINIARWRRMIEAGL